MEDLNNTRQYHYGMGSGTFYILDEFDEPTELGTVNTPIETIDECPDAESVYGDRLIKTLSQANEFECTLDCDLSEFFEKVDEAIDSAFDRLRQALVEMELLSFDLLEDAQEFTEKLERRNEEYSFHVKKYDKYSRSQIKQFKTQPHCNKNVPYRRCDRSK